MPRRFTRPRSVCPVQVENFCGTLWSINHPTCPFGYGKDMLSFCVGEPKRRLPAALLRWHTPSRQRRRGNILPFDNSIRSAGSGRHAKDIAVEGEDRAP